MAGWNTIKTTLLLGTLTGLLVVVGGLVGGRSGMIFAFVFAIAMNMGAWWFSDRIALGMSGAQEVSEAQAPRLYRLIAELSTRANLPMPRVFLIQKPQPNAFATGRDPQHSAVAVTTGIMQVLTEDELAGVIAHELAHIKHRDTLISSVAATIAGAISMLANMAQWSLFFGFGGRDDDDNPLAIVGLLLSIVLAPIAAALIQMAISRSREYSADAGGAAIMGDPVPLASALEKLELAAQRSPMQVNAATAQMYIVNPLRGGGLSGLFSTHPPTGERIKRLYALADTV